MSRLLSCSPLAIQEVADALDEQFPPVVLMHAKELSTEEGRIRIAERIGSRRVVDVLRLAVRKQQRHPQEVHDGQRT